MVIDWRLKKNLSIGVSRFFAQFLVDTVSQILHRVFFVPDNMFTQSHAMFQTENVDHHYFDKNQAILKQLTVFLQNKC